jgi:hypothetical protein
MRTPAGLSPNGVFNFDNPPTIGYDLLIVGAVFLPIMFVSASLRYFTVIRIRRRIDPDDCMLVLFPLYGCADAANIGYTTIAAIVSTFRKFKESVM